MEANSPGSVASPSSTQWHTPRSDVNGVHSPASIVNGNGISKGPNGLGGIINLPSPEGKHTLMSVVQTAKRQR